MILYATADATQTTIVLDDDTTRTITAQTTQAFFVLNRSSENVRRKWATAPKTDTGLHQSGARIVIESAELRVVYRAMRQLYVEREVWSQLGPAFEGISEYRIALRIQKIERAEQNVAREYKEFNPQEVNSDSDSYDGFVLERKERDALTHNRHEMADVQEVRNYNWSQSARLGRYGFNGTRRVLPAIPSTYAAMRDEGFREIRFSMLAQRNWILNHHRENAERLRARRNREHKEALCALMLAGVMFAVQQYA